jgi:AcrR family transcriptional regulator
MSSMTGRPDFFFPEGSVRDRIIVAATEVTSEKGWAKVTMGRLADRVGVSRQTVYNEIGSKPALAEAMILSELGRFLDLVGDAFDAEPDDVVAAVRHACRDVLAFAVDNTLLHAVVSASHGADTELLPLLTTHSNALVETAKAVVTERVRVYDLPISDTRLTAVIDMVVRLVLSHVMQPSDTPEATADGIAWIAERVLRD